MVSNKKQLYNDSYYKVENSGGKFMPSKVNLLLKEIENIKRSLSIIEEELKQIQNSKQETKVEKIDGEALDIWNRAIKVIKRELTEVSFNTWIKDIKPISEDNNYFYISAPNAFHQGIIEGRYIKLIENALMFVTDKKYIVEVLLEETSVNYTDYSIKWEANEDLDKTNSKYSFDNLIIGEYNKLAYRSVSNFTNDFYKKPRVIYIYGKVGLGKTHILKATKNHILEHMPSKKVKYMTIDSFIRKVLESISKDNNDYFINEIVSNDLLILDHFQDIKGKEFTQGEIIKIINHMIDKGKSILIASTESPVSTLLLGEKMNSLFEIEEIFEITELDTDTGIKILEKRIEDENIELDEEITKYIASNFNSNVRELINALNRVISFTNLTNSTVDLDMAVEILG